MATTEERANKLIERIFGLGKAPEEESSKPKIFKRPLANRMKEKRQKRKGLERWLP